MIISFSFKNFKNFKNEVKFSFEKGNKRELTEHIINKKGYSLLPLKVIYGSNSTGKTNILKAIEVLKNIVISGKVREKSDSYIALCSNFSSKKDYEKPIELAIEMLINNDIYKYEIKFKNFWESQKSSILEEKLIENNEIMFERKKDDINFSTKKSIIDKHYAIFQKKEIVNIYQYQFKKNILENQTFLSLYQSIDKETTQKIENYFYNNIMIIKNIEIRKIDLPRELKNKVKTDSKFTNSLVNKLLSELHQDKAKIYFKKEEENKPIKPIAKYIFSDSNDSIETFAEATESKGTLKLIDIIEPIVYSLKNGTVLMIDELDASIHHEIIYSIISAYGDPTINKKGAQLVFTTHNPVYMNERLLRRDEIVFVEKNDETSYINTLDDFDIRKDKKYLKNYLAGEFTILPNFDLGEIIEDVKD